MSELLVAGMLGFLAGVLVMLTITIWIEDDRD